MKKSKIILLVMIFLILIVPIVIYAVPTLGLLPVPKPYENVPTREELLEQRRLEKERITKEGSNKSIISLENNDDINWEEMENQYKKAHEQTEKEDRQFIDIMKRFYGKEVETMMEQIKEERDILSIQGNVGQIKSLEKLLNLVIDVINTKQLSNEDRVILKQYLESVSHNVVDETLKESINSVLKQDS